MARARAREPILFLLFFLQTPFAQTPLSPPLDVNKKLVL